MFGENTVKDDEEQYVCRVGIKMPPLWAHKPVLWFAQLDAQFVLSNITSDTTKFYHLISALDYKSCVEVEDVIENPPAIDKYETLKKQLIARLSASKENRVRQLLSHEELGERKPSQFLRHLRSLAGPEIPDDFLRALWSSRLPSYIQAIIATQTHSDLDVVAELADKIHEVSPSPPAIQQVDAASSDRKSVV